jgi:hypothetical protein
MRPIVTYVLLCEGSSDQGLVTVISELLRRAGADHVINIVRDYRGTTAEKLRELALHGPHTLDFVFLHRDSDHEDHRPRYAEVRHGFDAAGFRGVPVIPVQETEAWLLTDEDAIRSAVGNPNGRAALSLPAITKIEQTKNPKEVLQVACLAASEVSGGRLARARRRFPAFRQYLLENLDPDGPESQLPSFQRLVSDITEAMAGD